MIELRDISYVRLGTRDLEGATRYATDILGLEVAERSGRAVYFRSDARAHTLCYFEGDPTDHVAAFEIATRAELDAAAADESLAAELTAPAAVEEVAAETDENDTDAPAPSTAAAEASAETTAPVSSTAADASLAELTVAQLRARAREAGRTGYSRLTKAQLIDLLS